MKVQYKDFTLKFSEGSKNRKTDTKFNVPPATHIPQFHNHTLILSPSYTPERDSSQCNKLIRVFQEMHEAGLVVWRLMAGDALELR